MPNAFISWAMWMSKMKLCTSLFVFQMISVFPRKELCPRHDG